MKSLKKKKKSKHSQLEEDGSAFNETTAGPEIEEFFTDMDVPYAEEMECELELVMEKKRSSIEYVEDKGPTRNEQVEDKDQSNKENENEMDYKGDEYDLKFVSVAVGPDEPFTDFVSTAVGPDEPLSTVDRANQTSKRPKLDIETFVNDDEGVHFYTGLETFAKFKMVFSTLQENSKKLTYFYGHPPRHLKPLDNFFLTLMILRRNYTLYEMKRWFDITEKEVSNIYITWVRFMSLEWRTLSIWPSPEMVSFYSPVDFHDKFPDTRATIDGTECPIQQPSKPRAQQATFSTYKNRSTVKVLVGGTPGGLISYVSESYSGSTTDRQVVERGDLPQKCDFGDSILADKGFTVQDLFSPYGVKINMPSFFKKTNRLGDEKLKGNKKISSKRVHIERIMHIGKTYKILKKPLNSTETLISSDITFVCFMLCNFRKPIMNKYC